MLTGPQYAPASGGKPKQLVIMLHGVGADGQDLIGLAPYFAQALPDALFLSPDAPFAFDMAPIGRQWFSLMDYSAASVAAGVRHAAPILNEFIDQSLKSTGLDDRNLALIGFSQGTMMSLHVALRRPKACAALIGYSGRMASPESLPAEIVSRPPTLLIHGEQDEVVLPAHMPEAAAALKAAGVKVSTALCANVGHGIDDKGVALGTAFLADNLPRE